MNTEVFLQVENMKRQTCPKNTVKRALISHENEKEYDGLCEY